jgi:hypothetical protein
VGKGEVQKRGERGVHRRGEGDTQDVGPWPQDHDWRQRRVCPIDKIPSCDELRQILDMVGDGHSLYLNYHALNIDDKDQRPRHGYTKLFDRSIFAENIILENKWF